MGSSHCFVASLANQLRKKQQRSSGSMRSMSSDESWTMVGSPFAAEHPVSEEDPFSISAVAEEHPAASVAAIAEENPYSEPPAASVASAVAEADPYSEPFAAPAALLAIEDATPVAALALEDGPFGAALALEDAAPAAIDAAPAAIDAAEANDGQPGAQVFDLEYFRSYRPFTGACSQHNVALKYFSWRAGAARRSFPVAQSGIPCQRSNRSRGHRSSERDGLVVYRRVASVVLARNDCAAR